MKKSILTLLALCLCMIGIAQATIDPSLQREMSQRSNDEKVRIGIIMQEQSKAEDLLAVTNTFATNKERCEYVVKTLKQQAEASQADLLRLLEEMQRNGMVDDIRPLWIANAIGCEANTQVINDLAQRSDIKTIYHCENTVLPPTTNNVAVQPNEITRGIAQNILIINADKVWELGYTGEGVIVGHLDTGANYNHHDLQGRMWDGGEEFPHHGYDVYEQNNDPMDTWGHGTHVAGTICGTGAAGTQTGAAPGATLMEVKVFADEPDVESNEFILCEGMQFAMEHGAQVLNMSLGMSGDNQQYRRMMREGCDSMLAAGIVVVSTSGNMGQFQSFIPIPYNAGAPGTCPSPWIHPDQAVNPGGLSSVICVGSTENNDQVSAFSSRGPTTWADIPEYADYPYVAGDATQIGLIKPDVSAPGSNIVSLDWTNIEGYKADLGTSFAAPAVTGTIALMLSKNPDLTPAQIDEILETTAVNPIGYKNNDIGSGRIDALAAILAMDGCGPVANLDYTIENDIVTLTWEGDAESYLVFVDGEEIGSTAEPHFDLELEDGDHELCVAPSECPTQKSCVSLAFVGVGENKLQANVYPNPSAGGFTVECEGMTEVNVYAMDGKLVKQIATANGTCSIDGLSEGIYLLKIATENGTLNQRIVKY